MLVALTAGTVGAQNSETTGKPASGKSQTRKEIRMEKLDSEYRKLVSVIDSRQFILEADWLSNQWNSRISVPSNLNFIRVDSSEAVIQTGNNYYMGQNNVGGVTATGNIDSWLVTKNDKKKNLSMKMDVSTQIGFFTIFMDISATGNATATLSGSKHGKLIYTGRIVPLSESIVYKGSSY